MSRNFFRGCKRWVQNYRWWRIEVLEGGSVVRRLMQAFASSALSPSSLTTNSSDPAFVHLKPLKDIVASAKAPTFYEPNLTLMVGAVWSE